MRPWRYSLVILLLTCWSPEVQPSIAITARALRRVPAGFTSSSILGHGQSPGGRNLCRHKPLKRPRQCSKNCRPMCYLQTNRDCEVSVPFLRCSWRGCDRLRTLAKKPTIFDENFESKTMWEQLQPPPPPKPVELWLDVRPVTKDLWPNGPRVDGTELAHKLMTCAPKPPITAAPFPAFRGQLYSNHTTCACARVQTARCS